MVVLSHLHFDHAGNIALFKETNARLVCSAKEKLRTAPEGSYR